MMPKPEASRRQRRLDREAPPRLPLLWLEASDAATPHQQSLKRRLARLGFCIETADFTLAPVQPCPSVEFIVVCVTRPLHEQVPSLLADIRASSRAPLLLLAQAPEPEWSLAMLSAGADAVFDEETPARVILARCIALLRRWRPDVFR